MFQAFVPAAPRVRTSSLGQSISEEQMKRVQIFLILMLAALPAGFADESKQPLKLVATIPLPGLKDGDFDHFAPDIEGHRLFLTAE